MISPATRIFLGVIIFAVLAGVDLSRNGGHATRWREYLFLILCVAVAMAYGIINDQITSRISWEYFYYGKELAPIIGPQTPPDGGALSWQAFRIGLSATWWAGLVAGAAMLIANNPSKALPQLPYRRLVRKVPVLIGIVATSAAAFGLAGYLFLLNWINEDFRSLAGTQLWRPHRFLLVYGIHLGGYIGGIIATVFCFRGIRRERRLAAGGVEK